MKWAFYRQDNVSAEVSGVWDELNKTFGEHNPALNYKFISLLLKYFGDGDEIIAICSDSGRTIAGTILKKVGRGIWTVFTPGQACLCSFLVSPKSELRGVMSTLLDSLPGYCWLLKLPKMDPTIHCTEEFGKLGCTELAKYGTTFAIDLDTDFRSYWGSRSKRLRRNIRKAIEGLEAAGLETQLRQCLTPKCIDDAILTHSTLESSGWKGSDGTAIQTDNEQGSFYAELLTEYASLNRTFIYQMYLDDEPAASLLCIQIDGVAIVLKTAYQASFAKFSAGRLIDYYFIQECSEENHFKRVEMYTRAAASDLSWATQWRDTMDINVYRSALIKEAIGLAQPMRHFIKRKLVFFRDYNQ